MSRKFSKMSNDELWAFWSKYRRPSRAAAAAMVGDKRKGYTKICAALANYACNLAVARKCADDGDITGSAIYQKCCDLIESQLPVDMLCKLR